MKKNNVSIKGATVCVKSKNKKKEDGAEKLAKEELKKRGYELQDVITNGSGHGLDALATNSTEVFIVEVKANTATMNEEQKKGPTPMQITNLKPKQKG